jgi:DNA modification methylase
LTLIAANKIGRVCRGVELDPLYIDGIVRRFEAATGNETVLIRIGGAFDVFAERRSREAAPT